MLFSPEEVWQQCYTVFLLHVGLNEYIRWRWGDDVETAGSGTIGRRSSPTRHVTGWRRIDLRSTRSSRCESHCVLRYYGACVRVEIAHPRRTTTLHDFAQTHAVKEAPGSSWSELPVLDALLVWCGHKPASYLYFYKRTSFSFPSALLAWPRFVPATT